jgi:hypothetical protein
LVIIQFYFRGATRKVVGEKKQGDHSTKEGSYEIGSVELKPWRDWEIQRRMDGSMRIQPNCPPVNNYEQPLSYDILQPSSSRMEMNLGYVESSEPYMVNNQHQAFQNQTHTSDAQDIYHTGTRKSHTASSVVNSTGVVIMTPRNSTSLDRASLPFFDATSALNTPRCSSFINKSSSKIEVALQHCKPKSILSTQKSLAAITSLIGDEKVSSGSRDIPLLNKPSIVSFSGVSDISSEANIGYNKTATINQFWKSLFLVQQDSISQIQQESSEFVEVGQEDHYQLLTQSQEEANFSANSYNRHGSFDGDTRYFNSSIRSSSNENLSFNNQNEPCRLNKEETGVQLFTQSSFTSECEPCSSIVNGSLGLRGLNVSPIIHAESQIENDFSNLSIPRSERNDHNQRRSSVGSYVLTRSINGPRPAPFSFPTTVEPSKTSTVKQAFRKAFLRATEAVISSDTPRRDIKGPRPMPHN